MRFASILICLLGTAGCSTIDPSTRVEDWPELEIIEHKISFDEVQRKCGAYVGWGQWPLACATFYFLELKCVIWYAFDWSLEHERAHCRGLDHHGENSMAAMLRDWRARQ